MKGIMPESVRSYSKSFWSCTRISDPHYCKGCSNRVVGLGISQHKIAVRSGSCLIDDRNQPDAPDTDSAIELGEDAKIIFLDAFWSKRMNDMCRRYRCVHRSDGNVDECNG